MHARKANDELWKLTSAPANLGTFVVATVLLDGLDTDNEGIDAGERRNGTAREKIRSARNWFEILCGNGGGWRLAGRKPPKFYKARSCRNQRPDQ